MFILESRNSNGMLYTVIGHYKSVMAYHSSFYRFAALREACIFPVQDNIFANPFKTGYCFVKTTRFNFQQLSLTTISRS